MDKTRIAIFASGSGTNAENICGYFKDSDTAEVVLILSNKADAYVLQRAKRLDIPACVFSKSQLLDGTVLDILQDNKIGFVVLAGFLQKIPDEILSAFEHRIVNIHPSLLPKYGGKGMYGDKVHEAVYSAGETQSGITIHFLNEHYDEGDIIFQATCDILPGDVPDTIAAKVHALEYEYYPKVIDKEICRLRECGAANN